MIDEDRFLVLRAVRIKGLTGAGDVEAITGLGHSEAAAVLRDLLAEGAVREHSGRLAGFALTATGREAHADLAVAERETLPVAAVREGYAHFLALNAEFLRLASVWQQRPAGDSAWGLVDRLGEVHDKLMPACRHLEVAAARFGRYRPRFRHALLRLREGDENWFTAPKVDSYHTVWFQLHEDLLATLGLERSSEGET